MVSSSWILWFSYGCMFVGWVVKGLGLAFALAGRALPEDGYQ